MAKKEIEKKPPMPDGLAPDESKLVDSDMSVRDYASRIEAIDKARELLRREAQDGLNRRLGIDPEKLIGVTFNKSWRNYFADGQEYGFSEAVAGKLVKAGVARRVGDPKPGPKVTAQDLVDAARARRAAKKKPKAEQEANETVDTTKAKTKKEIETDKAKAEEDAKLEAEFDAALKAEMEASGEAAPDGAKKPDDKASKK